MNFPFPKLKKKYITFIFRYKILILKLEESLQLLDFQKRETQIFNVFIKVFRKSFNCNLRIPRLSSSLIGKPNNNCGKYYTGAYQTNNCKNDENNLFSLLKWNIAVWWKIGLSIPYCKILTKRVVNFGCGYGKRLLL